MLRGVVRPDGTVIAGNVSGVDDDACALSLSDLDVIELSEAFAAQGVAVPRDLGLSDDDPE